MAEVMYDFAENANVVQVCAQLTTAPDNGLECSIVATLLPMDGPKAGKYGFINRLLYNDG